MSYVKTNWENSPSTNSPINASNLNKIENAIASAVNKVSGTATLNADWQSGNATGTDFTRVGDLVISNFVVTLTSAVGNHLFIGTIPVGMRPTAVTLFPAIFASTGSSDYAARILIINPNGDMQLANSPSTTGTFLCSLSYFV